LNSHSKKLALFGKLQLFWGDIRCVLKKKWDVGGSCQKRRISSGLKSFDMIDIYGLGKCLYKSAKGVRPMGSYTE
jgi:predicted oxidoreductase